MNNKMKFFFAVATCLVAMAFTACSSDDEPASLTKEEIAQRFQVIKGNYEGNLVYALSGEGTSNFVTDTLDVKWEIATDSSFVVKDFPAKALTVNVTDKDLKEALANATPRDLKCRYFFAPTNAIQFFVNPFSVEYDLTYGEKAHKVKASFYVNNYSSYGAWNTAKNALYLQIVMAGIFEDGGTTNKLSKNSVAFVMQSTKKN